MGACQVSSISGKTLYPEGCLVVDRSLKMRVSPHPPTSRPIQLEIGQKNVAKIYRWFSDVKMVNEM